MKQLLDAKANPNIRGKKGYTAMHYAVEYYQPAIAAYVPLSPSPSPQGALIKTRTCTHMHTNTHALSHYFSSLSASSRVCPRLSSDPVGLSLLLAAGADLTIQNNEHRTPLELANQEMKELLLGAFLSLSLSR